MGLLSSLSDKDAINLKGGTSNLTNGYHNNCKRNKSESLIIFHHTATKGNAMP